MNATPNQNAGEPAGSPWSINSEILMQRVGDEVLLVHLGTNRIYELNLTAARLWELLVEGCDRATITERMLSEFDVEPEQLEAEIAGSLARFSSEGMLHAGQPG